MKSTRAEVARLAGVSPSVVSYVLNGGPRNVAPETRRRVEEAIASLEYRPNAIAKALRGGRSGAVGVVVGSGQELLFRSTSMALQRAAIARGYVMYVSFAIDAGSESQYARSLVDRQVDALIAVELENPEILSELREEGLPTAYVGEKTPPSSVLSLNTYPAATKVELLAAIQSKNPSNVVYSSRLAPWFSLEEIAEASRHVTVRSMDVDTVEGGSAIIHTLRTNPGSVVMCATDDELRRLLWLAGSSGINTMEHTFTNSRVDLSDHGNIECDIWVQWDLDRPFRSVFNQLIHQIGDTDAQSEPVALPWQLRSISTHSGERPRVWDVTDM